MMSVDAKLIELLNLMRRIDLDPIPLSRRALQTVRDRFWLTVDGRYAWLPDFDDAGPGTLFGRDISVVSDAEFAALSLGLFVRDEESRQPAHALQGVL